MLPCLRPGTFCSITCKIGHFNKQALQTILKVHSLREVKCKVTTERKWLAKTIVPPNGKCLLSRNHMKSYENLIFDTPDGRSVLDNNRSILASDLALLAGTQWLNYCILAGIVKLLQAEKNDTSLFMLNDLIQMDIEHLRRTIQQMQKKHKIRDVNSECWKIARRFLQHAAKTWLSLDIALH